MDLLNISGKTERRLRTKSRQLRLEPAGLEEDIRKFFYTDVVTNVCCEENSQKASTRAIKVVLYLAQSCYKHTAYFGSRWWTVGQVPFCKTQIAGATYSPFYTVWGSSVWTRHTCPHCHHHHRRLVWWQRWMMNNAPLDISRPSFLLNVKRLLSENSTEASASVNAAWAM